MKQILTLARADWGRTRHPARADRSGPASKRTGGRWPAKASHGSSCKLQLRISRFTPATIQVINLTQTDVGQPVGHIVSNPVDCDRLVANVQAVPDSLVPFRTEIPSVERPGRTQPSASKASD